MRAAIMVFIFLSLLTACGQAFLVVPGGRLSGELVSGAVDWHDLPRTIQVELRPRQPYSINLRVVLVERGIFIGTANQRSKWAKQIEADPSIRIGVDGKIYRLTASRVIEANKRGDVLRAYEEKYGLDSTREGISNMQLFELHYRQE